MHRGSLVSALVALLFMPGCYLSHGLREPEPGPIDAAPQRDAATPRRDAGPRTERDAGPPLTGDPDPDLGPGSRPSDYPDADEWGQPPALDDDEPCCELDEPVRVTSRDEGIVIAETPRIAWGPSRWGVLVSATTGDPWREFFPTVFLLEREGQPIGGPIVLTDTPRGHGEIRWAERRWAIAIEGASTIGDFREMQGRLYDDDLRPVSEWSPLGVARAWRYALARLTHGDVWLAALSDDGGLGVSPFSERGPGTPALHPAPRPDGLHAVGLRSRVAVVSSVRTGDETGHDDLLVVGGGPEHPLLGRIALPSRYLGAAAITALYDLVLVAGIEDGRAQAQILDPFELTTVSMPTDLGPATPSVTPRGSIDAAGSSKLGLVGVCYGHAASDDRRGEQSIDFRLVGPDGVPRGRSVRIVQGSFNGLSPSCAVGSDHEGFLVAWWDRDALWVRRVRVPR